MVTGNRKKIAARAIQCFYNQTWPNKELIIIDDGNEDLSELINHNNLSPVFYYRLTKKEENTLGYLRNYSLEKANGVFITQWDDDDWYHPDRIKVQAEVLLVGYDACCFKGTLMHLDNPTYFSLPYIGYLKDGVPGSIMHKKDTTVKYPEIRRAEDTLYLDQWREKKYKLIGREHSDKFIRCFHGSNTWESDHFIRRIHNNVIDFILWYVLVALQKKELHRRFKLENHEMKSFNTYLKDSNKLNLFITKNE